MNIDDNPTNSLSILVIVGATAVGKSETAILTAKELNGEIISADSRQFYRGLEIGSGAPDKHWLESVPHHYISSEPPEKYLTAGEFSTSGMQKAFEIAGRGKIPIVVGGSGLYVRSLIQGLAPTPPACPEIRRQINQSLNAGSYNDLFSELERADPEYSSIVRPSTPKRLVRALEVLRITGIPFSEWHRNHRPASWCNKVIMGLERPRGELRELIAQRTRSMINSGWLNEVIELVRHYGDAAHFPATTREAIGYVQLAQVIAGECRLQDAIEIIITATRQFAKRQMTWFKADKQTNWLNGSGSEAPKIWAEEIIRRWRSFDIENRHGVLA